jgi:hypothetical protein
MGRSLALLLSTALMAATLSAAPAVLQAQTKAGAYKVPRNAFGQPDISANWTNATITPESRPAAYGDRLVHTPEEVAKLEGLEVAEVLRANQLSDPNAPAPKVGGEPARNTSRPEYAAAGGGVGGYDRGWLEPGNQVMRVRGEARTSLITTPNGRAPARKAGAPTPGGRGGGGGGGGGGADNPEQRTLGDRCLISFGRSAGPPMLPNAFYNNNSTIVQSKDAVAIMVEMVHDTRVIRLNSTHRTDGVRPWFGDSIGWYEGDTLVIETTNIPQRQAYQGSWENLKVTERLTRTAPNRLHYAYTVEDPTLWDKPWGGEYEYARQPGQVYEYACHEGNHAMEGILAGARNEERIAAAAR